MLAIAIAVGAIIGLSLGALGGGGSILTVPALVYLLGQSPHGATTGSLLVVGVTALAGMTAHWRAGRVRVAQGMTFGALGVAGSYAGSRLAATLDPNALLSAFSALVLVAAVAMLRRGSPDRATAAATPAQDPRTVRRPVHPGAASADRAVHLRRDSAVVVLESPDDAVTCRLPSPSPRIDACRAAKVVAAATVVGLLTGLFGVGGGFVVVPALVLVLGFDMPTAVGTSLLVIAINSAVALGVRIGNHAHLDWPLLVIFTLAAIAGSFAGNRVASKVDATKLATAFSVLLIVVAFYTAARSVPHLM